MIPTLRAMKFLMCMMTQHCHLHQTKRICVNKPLQHASASIHKKLIISSCLIQTAFFARLTSQNILSKTLVFQLKNVTFLQATARQKPVSKRSAHFFSCNHFAGECWSHLKCQTFL